MTPGLPFLYKTRKMLENLGRSAAADFGWVTAPDRPFRPRLAVTRGRRMPGFTSAPAPTPHPTPGPGKGPPGQVPPEARLPRPRGTRPQCRGPCQDKPPCPSWAEANARGRKKKEEEEEAPSCGQSCRQAVPAHVTAQRTWPWWARPGAAQPPYAAGELGAGIGDTPQQSLHPVSVHSCLCQTLPSRSLSSPGHPGPPKVALRSHRRLTPPPRHLLPQPPPVPGLLPAQVPRLQLPTSVTVPQTHRPPSRSRSPQLRDPHLGRGSPPLTVAHSVYDLPHTTRSRPLLVAPPPAPARPCGLGPRSQRPSRTFWNRRMAAEMGRTNPLARSRGGPSPPEPGRAPRPPALPVAAPPDPPAPPPPLPPQPRLCAAPAFLPGAAADTPPAR